MHYVELSSGSKVGKRHIFKFDLTNNLNLHISSKHMRLDESFLTPLPMSRCEHQFPRGNLGAPFASPPPSPPPVNAV